VVVAVDSSDEQLVSVDGHVLSPSHLRRGGVSLTHVGLTDDFFEDFLAADPVDLTGRDGEGPNYGVVSPYRAQLAGLVPFPKIVRVSGREIAG